MTLVVSTSSPVVSGAVFGADGALLRETSAHAPMAASAGSAGLVRELLAGEQPDRIAVDAGPGGFTAVRGGLALCKALAWAWGVPLGRLSAFDLIEQGGPVAIPAKQGSWWVREPGREPSLVTEVGGASGYRLPSGQDRYPSAGRAGPLLPDVEWLDPALVVPEYLAEPSISVPKAGRPAPRAAQ